MQVKSSQDITALFISLILTTLTNQINASILGSHLIPSNNTTFIVFLLYLPSARYHYYHNLTDEESEAQKRFALSARYISQP